MARFAPEMSDQQLVAELVRVKNTASTDADLAATIARELCASGELYEPIGDVVTADVASTGGPTSLSTLLVPLFLSASGLHVPKLGVPGRPAGGLDCLAQIPGYRTRLSRVDVDHALSHANYAHFEAAGIYAPLDSRLFRLRQSVGAQQVPTLVVASLLAKKVAVGVRRAGLDVRVAPFGNFGADMTAAALNARIFYEAAIKLKIHAYPVLTDGRFPYQSYVGRRESLLALSDVFEGRASGWLLEHLEQARTIATLVAPSQHRTLVARTSVGLLRKQFMLNIEAQGACEVSFNKIVSDTRNSHDYKLIAARDGFTNYSLPDIRDVFTRVQNECSDQSPYPDPIGLTLNFRAGTWVEKGQTIATARLQNAPGCGSPIAEITRAVCHTSALPTNSTTVGIL